MFSNTLRREKIDVTWKLRERPRRVISCGSSPSMRRPCSSMRPAESGKRPLTRLKSVVLPAPFGPMMAWREPVATSRVTPMMTAVGPKLFSTSMRRSAGAVTRASPPP